MKKMEVACKKCGAPCPVESSFCPVCGAELVIEFEDFVRENQKKEAPKEVLMRIGKSAGPIAAVVFFLLLLLGLFTEPSFNVQQEPLSSKAKTRFETLMLALDHPDSTQERSFTFNENELNTFIAEKLPLNPNQKPLFAVQLSDGSGWLYLRGKFGRLLPGYYRMKFSLNGKRDFYIQKARMGVIPAWFFADAVQKEFSETAEKNPLLCKLSNRLDSLEITDTAEVKIKLRDPL